MTALLAAAGLAAGLAAVYASLLAATWATEQPNRIPHDLL